MSYTWTDKDDILTFYLYRYGEEDLISLDYVATHIDFNETGS